MLFLTMEPGKDGQTGPGERPQKDVMREVSDVQEELCCAFQGALQPELTHDGSSDDSGQLLLVLTHPCSPHLY